MTVTTSGLVCGHHHLYSALARGMPAPTATPTTFTEILERVWWRLDVALDLEMIRWSAMLGALEALECGTTAIVDHHESPAAIEGSLDVIAEACAEVGVRVLVRATASPIVTVPTAPDAASPRTNASCAPEDEGCVGVHAAFTCSDDDARRGGGPRRRSRRRGACPRCRGGGRRGGGRSARASRRRRGCSCTASISIVTCPGTIAHNPRSNMNNAVGYAWPARSPNPVVLGTDGIGADMLEEFRLAFARAPRGRRDRHARDGVDLAHERASGSCPRRATTR